MWNWIVENPGLAFLAWLAIGCVCALGFGKAASLGKTKEEQDYEDEAQAAWLDEYFKNNQ